MLHGGTVFLIIFIVYYATVKIGIYGMFKKAGYKPHEAFIPYISVKNWSLMIGRPAYWGFLFYVPIVGEILMVTLMLESAKVFGRPKIGDFFAAIVVPPIYLCYLGWSDAKYIGHEEGLKLHTETKSIARDWSESILWAGGAAMVIRAFFIEAFMIPTSSMESSMMVGDFLFVSKFQYGVRMPMNPLTFPFVHNKLPFINAKSFLSFQLPYYRLPGFQNVERNDIVVFNYPADDIQPNNPDLGPIDIPSLKENYIKRCVGIPNDTLEVREGVLFINGKENYKPENFQLRYHVQTTQLLDKKTLENLGLRINPAPNYNCTPISDTFYEMHLTPAGVEKVKSMLNFKSIERAVEPKEYFVVTTEPLTEAKLNELNLRPIQKYGKQFGNYLPLNQEMTEFNFFLSPEGVQRFANMKIIKSIEKAKDNRLGVGNQCYPLDKPWDLDNYGPIILPKKGTKITLTKDNISIYQRCIEAYEYHKFENKGGKYFIDGKETTEFTFELDYYFMMGDNRYNSLDSRFWGFVPETHIIGKPLFVLFSFEKGLRMDRLFKFVK